MRRHAKGLALGTGLILVLAASVAAAAAQTVDRAVPSKQEVILELANTQRMLADEEFILGDRARAGLHYKDARQTLSGLGPNSGSVLPGDVQILSDEVDYRKQLLESHASFWGLEFQARPVNPVSAFRQFTDTYNAFSNAVDEIDTLVDQGDVTGGQKLRDDIDQAKANSDARVSELQKGVTNTKVRAAEIRRSMYNDRVQAIHTRQDRLAADIAQLRASMDSRNSAINSELVHVATASLGLPKAAEDVVQGAASGDIKQAVGGIVQSYISSPNLAGISNGELKKLAGTVDAAVQRYGEIKQLQTSIEEKAKLTGDVLRAVQTQDRDQLLRVGLDALNKLSPQTQGQLMDALGKITDVRQVIEFAGSASGTREILISYISQSADFSSNVGRQIATRLATGNNQERQFEILLAGAVASADAARQADLLAVLASAWPRSLVDDVLGPKAAIQPVARLFGGPCESEVACRAWLIERIEAQGFSSPSITIPQAGIVAVKYVDGRIVQFNVLDLVNTIANRAVESETFNSQAQIGILTERLRSGETRFVSEVIRRLSPLEFDQSMGTALGTLTSQSGNDLLAKLNAKATVGSLQLSPASKDRAAYTLGVEIAEKAVFGRGQAPGAAAGGAGAGLSAEEQQLLNAISASGPYGAVAGAAVRILSAMSQNSSDSALINEKAREDAALTVEMLHLVEFQTDIQRDQAVATLEGRIADLQTSEARDRADKFTQALLSKGQQSIVKEEKIRRRLPLIFYLSELLRQRFMVYDRAIGFWTNDFDADHGFVERSVRADPRYRRLQLDPDIRLYDWFKRDIEGQRQDLDALKVHWQQLYQVAAQVCDQYHCTKDDSVMGFIGQTSSISLKQLVGPTAWKNAASSPNRQLAFTLLPRNLPDVTKDGLRVVAAAGAIVTNGAERPPISVLIQHSGLGYVSAQGRGYRETSDASESIELLTEPGAGLNAFTSGLQQRWTSSQSLLGLEGYPLYGLYRITFPSTFDFATSDLQLHLFFQSPRESRPADALPRIMFGCKAKYGLIEIDPSLVKLLLATDGSGLPSISGSSACALEQRQ